ncbi:MAG: formate/nitrite transporter family protein [Streptococcus salivarius]
MLAGAYLTHVNCCRNYWCGCYRHRYSSPFSFVFAFIFAIGLVFVLIFNGELATSNMMFLTSGAYYGKIKWSKGVPSSSTVPSLILSVPLSWPGSSTNPSLSNI